MSAGATGGAGREDAPVVVGTVACRGRGGRRGRRGLGAGAGTAGRSSSNSSRISSSTSASSATAAATFRPRAVSASSLFKAATSRCWSSSEGSASSVTTIWLAIAVVMHSGQLTFSAPATLIGRDRVAAADDQHDLEGDRDRRARLAAGEREGAVRVRHRVAVADRDERVGDLVLDAPSLVLTASACVSPSPGRRRQLERERGRRDGGRRRAGGLGLGRLGRGPRPRRASGELVGDDRRPARRRRPRSRRAPGCSSVRRPRGISATARCVPGSSCGCGGGRGWAAPRSAARRRRSRARPRVPSSVAAIGWYWPAGHQAHAAAQSAAAAAAETAARRAGRPLLQRLGRAPRGAQRGAGSATPRRAPAGPGRSAATAAVSTSRIVPPRRRPASRRRSRCRSPRPWRAAAAAAGCALSASARRSGTTTSTQSVTSRRAPALQRRRLGRRHGSSRRSVGPMCA